MLKSLPIQSYSALSPEEMQVGLQVARVGVGTVDYEADTVRVDELTAALFGLPAGEDVPRSLLHSRIHPDDWPMVEKEVEKLIDPDDDDVIDLTHRVITADGDVRWVNARKKVRFAIGERGSRPLDGVFAIVDITERVAAENRVDVLLGELNHRAKNLFAVVLSVVRQLKRFVSADEFPDKLTERLEALVRNQDAIVRSADQKYDLETVIRQQLLPFEGGSSERISVAGKSLAISPEASQVLAMVFHELLTNAIKHGALSNKSGKVAISFDTDPKTERFRLSWREEGGPAVVEPERQGYGTRVLTSLAEMSLQSQISLDYDPAGVRYDLEAPINRICV